MQAFTAGVPDDELVLAAFDPGEHRPFTAAVSMPTSDGGRNEALCHVKRGGMLGLSRRAQQHSAAFNNVFYGDLVLDSTDPALRTDGQHGPVLLDTTDQLVKSTLSALYRMNSRRQQLESEAKLRLEAEYSSIADEVRWTLTGGEQFRGGGKKPPGGLKLVVSVGKGIFARSGQQRGASTTAGLLRKLEERLNMVTTDDGKTLEYVIVIAPEDFTSQCCSQPDCVDAEGRRNRMMPAVRTIGSVDGALHWCPACVSILGHDNAGAFNLLAQTMTLQRYGRKMWDKRWGKAMWAGTAAQREAKWRATEEAKARARARAGP